MYIKLNNFICLWTITLSISTISPNIAFTQGIFYFGILIVINTMLFKQTRTKPTIYEIIDAIIDLIKNDPHLNNSQRKELLNMTNDLFRKQPQEDKQ